MHFDTLFLEMIQITSCGFAFLEDEGIGLESGPGITRR